MLVDEKLKVPAWALAVAAVGVADAVLAADPTDADSAWSDVTAAVRLVESSSRPATADTVEALGLTAADPAADAAVVAPALLLDALAVPLAELEADERLDWLLKKPVSAVDQEVSEPTVGMIFRDLRLVTLPTRVRARVAQILRAETRKFDYTLTRVAKLWLRASVHKDARHNQPAR